VLSTHYELETVHHGCQMVWQVSEGLDFADGNARAVLVVGIPYPHIKDRKVRTPSAYFVMSMHPPFFRR